jgi:hypothetical protein
MVQDYQLAAAGFEVEAKRPQLWLQRFALLVGAGIAGVIMVTVLMALLAKPAGADQVTVQVPVSPQGPVSVSVPVSASVPVTALPVPVNIAAPITVAEPAPPVSLQPAAVVGAVTGAAANLASTSSNTLGALNSSTSPVVTPVLQGTASTVTPVVQTIDGATASIATHAGGSTGVGSLLGSVDTTVGGTSTLSAFSALTGHSLTVSEAITAGASSLPSAGLATPSGSPASPVRFPAPSVPASPSPQAPNNAGESLVVGQGNTPFRSLPPSMLLLPALVLGAVALMRNRIPKLLLDLRFAPPG